MAAPWFDPNTFAAWFGAIGGSVCGILGAVVGTAAGVLAPRGKGRPWVLGLMWACVGLGVACLAFGLVALVSGQSYGIWYAPLLVGVLFTVIFGTLIPVVRRRYAEAEARRVEAEGLRRG